MVLQDVTEALLSEHLMEQGVLIERGVELLGLTQQAGEVDVLLRPDGREEYLRVGWLVGYNGAHSSVHHPLDMEFVGSTFKQHFLLADVRVEWPEEKPQDEIFAFVQRGDLIAFFPMVSGRYRIIVAY